MKKNKPTGKQNRKTMITSIRLTMQLKANGQKTAQIVMTLDG